MKDSEIPNEFFEIIICPLCSSSNQKNIFSVNYGKLKQKPSLDYSNIGIKSDTKLYVKKCRKCMLEIFEKEYIAIFKHKFNSRYVRVLKFILSKNIVCGDALTMKGSNGEPLVFSEWSMPYNDSKIKRREYSFKDIFSPNLLWSFTADSDTGERVVLPNVHKDHPIINYMELVDDE